MKHFSTENWVDFARQVQADPRDAMQKHLDEGCGQCFKAAALWRDIVQTINLEKKSEPPAGVIRAVNATFGLQKEPLSASGKIELATLFFDSALQPVTGVRGTPAIARQLLYKSGNVCIDMRMQTTPGSDAAVLMGQLLDSKKPDHGIGDIPVSLLCKGDTVSSNRTNEVGEFDFSLGALKRLRLVFGLSESRTIVVPVPDSAEARA